MKTSQWLTVMIVVTAMVLTSTAQAGDLDPTNAPAPTMHSLEEIYQKLNSLEQRMGADGLAEVVDGMVLIPAGPFEMGDSFDEGAGNERPRHTVTVSAFYMDQYEVTKAQWDEVYDWAITNGYSYTNAGLGKATSHPVHAVNWHDCVKWCNARSQKAGRTAVYRYVTYGILAPPPIYNIYKTGERDDIVTHPTLTDGYRLPTEAEWEKAARGGATGRRFPWSADNTIQHARANYSSRTNNTYDTSPTRGYHPSYTNAPQPYTSPVGSFAPNGYGLYDMAGNVMEWCWDWYQASFYSDDPVPDPTGPDGPSTFRVVRGGVWNYNAESARCAYRNYNFPDNEKTNIGFRCVREL